MSESTPEIYINDGLVIPYANILYILRGKLDREGCSVCIDAKNSDQVYIAVSSEVCQDIIEGLKKYREEIGK